MCRDLNMDKTLLGTQTHKLFIRIILLLSRLTEAQVHCVSVQKEFSERQSDGQEIGLLT